MPKNRVAGPKTVRSFDLFDTLIGRLHHRPDSIFTLVEKKFSFPGFSFYRMAAECSSDRTLPGIYRRLQQMIDITEKESSLLMDFEFETELSQIFPIHENCNLVQDGDLIVTDTYYNESQVREILKKIGLRRKVRVYASPRGKHSGAIWDTLQKKHTISCHLGDSLHSDIAMAKSRGIEAIHYSGSQLSPIEQALMDIGQNSLAYIMRTLRLQNPYPSQSPEFLIWNEQSQLNVPLLIQASLYLNTFCQERGKKRILFTARDGCLWIQLFQKLFPHYDSIYFHTSRFTYTFATPSFIEYVKSVHSEDAVIVDSHGKGSTCERFFREHFKIKPTYLAIVNSGRKHHAIVRRKMVHEGVEKMNYDVVGALYDVQEAKPIRSPTEYDMRFVRPSHACIEKCGELLPNFVFGPFDQQIVEWAVNAMESALTLDKYIDHAALHIYLIQEKKQVHRLRSGYLLVIDC